jgi:hypothetical protein
MREWRADENEPGVNARTRDSVDNKWWRRWEFERIRHASLRLGLEEAVWSRKP